MSVLSPSTPHRYAHLGEEADGVVKVRARIREHVEEERLDVKVDGLVVDEEFAEKRQILRVQLSPNVSADSRVAPR